MLLIEIELPLDRVRVPSDGWRTLSRLGGSDGLDGLVALRDGLQQAILQCRDLLLLVRDARQQVAEVVAHLEVEDVLRSELGAPGLERAECLGLVREAVVDRREPMRVVVLALTQRVDRRLQLSLDLLQRHGTRIGARWRREA